MNISKSQNLFKKEIGMKSLDFNRQFSFSMKAAKQIVAMSKNIACGPSHSDVDGEAKRRKKL